MLPSGHQFTHEEFADKKDVYFVNLKLTSGGPITFRKGARTGQYIHFKSFTPWS